MTKILVLSDDGSHSGYARISVETNLRLHKRGYHVLAQSLQFDGLLPPNYEGQPLPYWVGTLGGRADWLERFVSVIAAYQPDVIISCQDAPYSEALRNAPIDWSKYIHIVITAVDGVPVSPQWVNVLKHADAVLIISEFGVKAYQEAGIEAKLCRPAADSNVFFKLPDAQRAELRTKMSIPADAFVLGTMAMNQGRKAISFMLKGFFEFAKGKPNARYFLDMDANSPVGWNIPQLCEQYGWDVSKLLFRADAVRAGLMHLRERYALLDAMAVISHREGFGIPLEEAKACGVVAIAQAYCSGTEICGDSKGVLVKVIDYDEPGTWGGATEKFADLSDFVAQLQRLYDDPDYRNLIAKAGTEDARAHSWDTAADAVQNAVETALKKRAAVIAPQSPPQTAVQLVQTAQQPHSPDGVVQKEVALVEG